MIGRPVDTSVYYFSDRLKAALAAIEARPLVAVEAPMGYGKTVAVREYLQRGPMKTVWVPVLGAGPEVFWRDFCRSLERAFPGSDDVTAALRGLGYPHDPVKAGAARELLLDLDFRPATVLVVDDFHLLPNPGPAGPNGFGQLAELLARSAPGGLHLVLITRDDYAGHRELLVLKGILGLVDRGDLALTAPEIMEYYHRCGLELTMAEARRLHADTLGWISALHLNLLACSAPEGRSAAASWGGGTGRDGGLIASALKRGRLGGFPAVNALVEKEILAPLSPAALELVVRLYPLERFTPDQAEDLGLPDVGRVLDELLRRNSFLNFNGDDHTYAFHGLVRQVVEEKFNSLPLSVKRETHRRLADRLARDGQAVAAIEHYQAAGEFEKALEVLEADLSGNLVTEKAGFFTNFFKDCPAGILETHLPAVFKFALAAFSSGDFVSFGEQMAWLGQRLAAMPSGDAEADGWRGELELLRSLAAYNDIEAMSRHHRRANALLKRPTRLYRADSPWTLGSPSVLYMFHRQSGALAEEVRRMHECLPHYYTLTDGHGSGGEYLMEAEARYMQGDFNGAAAAVHRAEAMAVGREQRGNILCARFLRLRLALMRGDYPLAEDLLGQMRRAIREKRDFFLLHTVDLIRGYLSSALGRLEEIPKWLLRGQGGEKRLYSFAGGYYYLVYGRVLLVDGRPAEAEGLFTWLMESGAFGRNLLFTIHGLMYAAAARRRMGRPKEAAEALAEALGLALPDRLYMPLVENWDYLAPISKTLKSKALKDGLNSIRALGAIWEKRKNGILVRHFAAEKPPLTPREEDLVRLALKGRKYREIAEALFLAPTTVKKAFVKIYAKLGVSSRQELRDFYRRLSQS